MATIRRRMEQEGERLNARKITSSILIMLLNASQAEARREAPYQIMALGGVIRGFCG